MATAATKVSRVLEVLSARPSGVSIKEIAGELSVTREAATRFMRSLVDENLLEYDESTDLYAPGIRLIRFGSAAVARIGPVDGLYDPMLQMSREYRVPVMFSVTRGADTYVLFRAQPAQFGAVIVPLGHSRPTHATAAGRVFLAFGNEDMLPAVEAAGLRKLTDHTVDTMDGLREQLELALRQGFLTTSEEVNIGQHVIAVPVLDHRRRAVATLAVSLIDEEEFERSKRALVSELQRLAQTASHLFAFGHALVHAV